MSQQTYTNRTSSQTYSTLMPTQTNPNVFQSPVSHMPPSMNTGLTPSQQPSQSNWNTPAGIFHQSGQTNSGAPTGTSRSTFAEQNMSGYYPADHDYQNNSSVSDWDNSGTPTTAYTTSKRRFRTSTPIRGRISRNASPWDRMLQAQPIVPQSTLTYPAMSRSNLVKSSSNQVMSRSNQHPSEIYLHWSTTSKQFFTCSSDQQHSALASHSFPPTASQHLDPSSASNNPSLSERNHYSPTTSHSAQSNLYRASHSNHTPTTTSHLDNSSDVYHTSTPPSYFDPSSYSSSTSILTSQPYPASDSSHTSTHKPQFYPSSNSNHTTTPTSQLYPASISNHNSTSTTHLYPAFNQYPSYAPVIRQRTPSANQQNSTFETSYDCTAGPQRPSASHLYLPSSTVSQRPSTSRLYPPSSTAVSQGPSAHHVQPLPTLSNGPQTSIFYQKYLSSASNRSSSSSSRDVHPGSHDFDTSTFLLSPCASLKPNDPSNGASGFSSGVWWPDDGNDTTITGRSLTLGNVVETDQHQLAAAQEGETSSRSTGLFNDQARKCANCNTESTIVWRKDKDANYLCNACGIYYRNNKGQSRPLDKPIREICTTEPPGTVCSNCSATTTSLWRKNIVRGQKLCNACGLYFKLHAVNRPIEMKQVKILTRNRKRKSKSVKQKDVTSKQKQEPAYLAQEELLRQLEAAPGFLAPEDIM